MKLKRLSSVLLGLIAVFSVSSCDFINNSQSSNNVSVSSGDNTTIPTTTNTTPDISTSTNTIPSTSTGSDVTTTNTQPTTTTTTTTTTTQGGSGQVNPPVTFTVTFVTNGGTTVNPQTVNAGDSISTVSTSKSGYTFGGWYTDQALKNSDNVSSPVTSALTLYAKWNEIVVDNVITDYSAYNEGAYVTFNVKNSTNANNSSVSYSTDGVNYTKIDKELIRYNDSTKKARADILGLKSGSYIIKVNNGESESITNTINVSADDRSGYAHFKNTTGVGAYNDDGTLKNNADVIYVSDSNRNTTAFGGKTGLANILKAPRSTPLCVRFLDTIKTCQFNTITYNSSPKTENLLTEQANSLGGNKKGYSAADIIKNGWNSYSEDLSLNVTTLDGLNSKVSYSSGEFDTYWNMCDISSASNITLEGVGENAGLYQWGITWSKCNSIEVKNLTFTDYTEDACSFQGGSNSDVKTYGNYWVHNCTFNRGKNNWDFTFEQDKHYGDGATDFKFCNSITSAYNVFNNCKKTGLVGGGNSNYTMNVTFHHNFYNTVGSRLPLGRQANMHIYNNYYYSCSTCQDIRANAFVLSEANYFEYCQNPQKVSKDETYTGTVIKSYNDKLIGCGSSAATVVTDRTATLSGECKPDGSTNYTNFDTNSNIFYYDSTKKCSDVSILTNVNDVNVYVPSVAGAGTLPNFNIGSFSPIDTNKEKFTVTFETNGGTAISQQTVLDGSTISSVSTTKSGFEFKGWFTDKELKNSFNVSTPITSNLTLYAKWEEKAQSNDTVLTFNNFTAGSISSTTTKDGITLTTGKTISINSYNTEINGTNITNYVSFSGGGNYSSASVQFKTTASANITVYFAGNVGSSGGRKIGLYPKSGTSQESSTTSIGSASGDATKIVNYTFENVSAGDYAVASTNSSIEIYAIVISYN